MRVLVLPSNLSRKVAGEESTIEDFYKREHKRVEYFQHRFTIRDEEARQKKTDQEADSMGDTGEKEVKVIQVFLFTVIRLMQWI